MNILNRKGLFFKLIVAICVFLTLFNFVPSNVYAADGTGLGGKLLEPVCDLLAGLGDGIMSITQNALIGIDDAVIRINNDGSDWKIFFTIAAGVVATIAVATILTLVTGGLGTLGIIGAIVATGISAVATPLSVGAGVLVAVSVYSADWWGDEIVLPIYKISIEDIFKNNIQDGDSESIIPIFDVNFFESDEELEKRNIDRESGSVTYTYYDGISISNIEEWGIEEGYFTQISYYLFADRGISISNETEEVTTLDGNTISAYTINLNSDCANFSDPNYKYYFRVDEYSSYDELRRLYFTTTYAGKSTMEGLGYTSYDDFQKDFPDDSESQLEEKLKAANEDYSGFSVIRNMDGLLVGYKVKYEGGNEYIYYFNTYLILLTEQFNTSKWSWNNENIRGIANSADKKFLGSGLAGDIYANESDQEYLKTIMNIADLVYVFSDEDKAELRNIIMGQANISEDTRTTTTIYSSAYQLKPVIAKWYYILRNLAIVGLMSVLVYIGIKMLLTSIASEKAKYKKMMLDWVVALILIFIMHYIMVFANIFVDKITNLLDTVGESDEYIAILKDEDNKIEDAIDNDSGFEDQEITDESQINSSDASAGKIFYIVKDGIRYYYWSTNSIGYARINTNMTENDNLSYAAWTIVFIVLVFYLIFFSFTYIRRVLYMAFLTMMAPLVALTYPIDKIKDGKAQAWDMWFKEYIFNLLIQPLHLLLYTVLIKSAFELATSSIIYTIVAIGFMIPAEKLIRKFFGFEKAQTPGLLAGAAGAATTMSLLGNLRKIGEPGKHPGGSSKESNSSSKDDSYIRTADSGNTLENQWTSAFGFNNKSPNKGSVNNNSNTNNGFKNNYSNSNEGENTNLPIDFNGFDNDNIQDNYQVGLDGANFNVAGNQNADEISKVEQEMDKYSDYDQYVKGDEYGALQEKLKNLRTVDLGENDYSTDLGKINMNEPMTIDGNDYSTDFNNIGMNNSQMSNNEPKGIDSANNIRLDTDKINSDVEEPQDSKSKLSAQEKLKEFKKENGVGPIGKLKKNLKYARSSPNEVARKAIKVVRSDGWNAVKTTARFTTKALSGAVGAGAGMALGFASGDINKVAQNTYLGFTAGNNLGEGVSKLGGNVIAKPADSLIDEKSFNKLKADSDKERYGAKYSEYQKLKSDVEFMKDFDNRKKFAEELGLTTKDEIDEYMEKAIKYRSGGVKDNDTIIKAMKLEDSSLGEIDSEKRILIARAASNAKTEKDLENITKRLKEKGATDKDLTTLKNNIRLINKDNIT